MIYTSYFGNIKHIEKSDSKMIFYSIAGYTPSWYMSMDIVRFRTLKMLAPKKVWWQEWHAKFEKDLNSDESKTWYKEKYYETVLSKLNAEELMNILNVDNHNICLLCYETADKFCHRQIVSEWLNQNHIKCEEYHV